MSESEPDVAYEVAAVTEDHTWSCTCPYHVRGRGRICKHIDSIQGLAEGVKRVERQIREIVVSVDDDDVRCDECGSRNVRLRERRKKDCGEISDMYRCGKSGCGKKFVYNPGFTGRHYGLDVITDALRQMAAGLSPEETSDWLATRGQRPSPTTTIQSGPPTTDHTPGSFRITWWPHGLAATGRQTRCTFGRWGGACGCLVSWTFKAGRSSIMRRRLRRSDTMPRPSLRGRSERPERSRIASPLTS